MLLSQNNCPKLVGTSSNSIRTDFQSIGCVVPRGHESDESGVLLIRPPSEFTTSWTHTDADPLVERLQVKVIGSADRAFTRVT
jgi:hypothetical protein